MKSFHAACVSAIVTFFLAPLMLAQSAAAQTSCAITEIRPGNFSNCETEWQTYSRSFEVTYTDAPSSGNLTIFATGDGVFVSATAAISGSPQTLMLNGLPLNGFEVTVSASFSAAPDCRREITYLAPARCEDIGNGNECHISALDALEQTECNPETNTYTQYVQVTYENPVGDVLVVHGQAFEVAANPQIVELTGLPADGKLVDVTAYFQDQITCRATVYGLFRAPESCEDEGGCAITALVKGSQTDCDPETNTYTQQVQVTYENPVGSVLVVNGQQFNVASSPQTVTLTGLVADSMLVDVVAFFESAPDCKATQFGLFRAPPRCDDDARCSIFDLAALDQTECDPETNTYTQYVEVTYENPAGDVLVVHGQSFNVTGSPQTVKLTGLPATGMPVDVTAYFQAQRDCAKTVLDLFTAPERCAVDDACRITDIRFGSIMDCNEDTGKYSVTVYVLYENEPDNGLLAIVAFDGFPAVSISVPITGSPQQVTLNGLPANGQSVSFQASFSADAGCSLTKKHLYDAPQFCEPVDCRITGIIDDNNTICDPATNRYSHQLIIEYENPPSQGDLIVNDQHFAIAGSPQTVVLEDLPANGFPVDVTARFSADPGCFLVVPAVFVAPDRCDGDCTIRLHAGDQTPCDEETNTYSQQVFVSYSNPPQTGELALVVGLNVRLVDFDPQASSVQVLLTGLQADGQPVSVTAFFTDQATCETTKDGLFTAPPSCDGEDKCDIRLDAGDQTPCDEETNTYSQQVLVSYSNPPQTGELALVVGLDVQLFDFDPQASSVQVLLTGLQADGQPVSVTAFFTDQATCEETEDGLFTAPPPCDGEEECDVDIRIGDTECEADDDEDEDGGEYTQEIIVDFENAPTTGTLQVSLFSSGFGERTATINMTASTTSPQVFVFENLPADGLVVGACVTFSDDDDCKECEGQLYTAPEDCDDGGDGDHTLDFVFLGDEEVRIESPNDSEGAIHCNDDIRFIGDNGTRGLHTGDLTAVDDIAIEGRNTIDGDAIAGGDLEVGDHAEVTGERLEDQDVEEIEIPPDPDVDSGDKEIHIGDGLTRTVQPGDYEKIKVGEDGKLILRSGVYNVDELVMEEGSLLSIEIKDDKRVTINVDSRLEFDDEVRMDMEPEMITTLVFFNYADDDRDVKFGKGAIVVGTILAPEATVRLDEGSFFKGAICAERILVEELSTFAPHDSDVLVPQIAETAGANPTDTAPGAQGTYRLSASPNPFNPNIRIDYSVPHLGDISLSIYTAKGRVVRRLVRSQLPSGTYSVVWNGRDERGMRAPSARYYAVLRSGGVIKKSLGIVLLR